MHLAGNQFCDSASTVWAGSLDPRNHHSVSARVHFAVQTARTDDGCMLSAIVQQRNGPRLVHAANRFPHVEPRISLRLALSLYRWEFRLTLNVIARILPEVVNRVKLGHHHTQRRSRGEVCLCVCLFVCLFG